MEPSTHQQKMHYVSITAIVRKGDRFLICKRSPNEKVFPGKWCVPGGKIEMGDFISTPKDTSDHWLDIFEKTIRKEVLEETGLSIRGIGYVSSLVFIRPNGCSTIIVSMHAEWERGDVVLQMEELTDYAWVTLEEAEEYDLIENIIEQMRRVESMSDQPLTRS